MEMDEETSKASLAAEEAPDTAQRWYLPGWGERLKLMQWRLLYFVPAVVALAALVWLPFAIAWLWKIIVIAVAIPVTAAMNSAKRAIRMRKEPFCIHCGYNMTGLPDGHRCPECGAVFWHGEMEEYRRDPHWYIQRQKLGKDIPISGAVFDAGPGNRRRSRDGT
jgi:hypothetical protein